MLAEIRAAAARREAKARSEEEPRADGHVEMEDTQYALADGDAHPAMSAPAASAAELPLVIDAPNVRAQIIKYKTMLRVGIRLPSVLRKMGEDAFDVSLFDEEVDRADIDQFYLPAYLVATQGSSGNSARKTEPQPTRKKIHIPVITKSKATLQIVGAVAVTTLWNRKCENLGDFTVSAETRKSFNALFTVTPCKNKDAVTSTTKSKSSASSTLIDKVRAQNIAILLVGMKLSTEEWRECILNLTFEQNFCENLKMLLPVWPTSDEERAIQAYDGDVEKLGRAESFLVELRDIPRLKKKIECLHFRLLFFTRVFELRESMLVVIRAVNQIIEKDKFAAAMQHIFRLCCVLNDGDAAVDPMATPTGFRMSALTQLLCARSLDPDVSVLRAIIQAIERDHPELGMFTQELTLLNKCASMSLTAIRSELASIENGYNQVLEESMSAGTMKLEAVDDALFVESLKNFRAAINSFAAEADLELQGLRVLAGDMNNSVQRLNQYLEEAEATPFNDVIGHIATFVDAYAAERENIMHLESEDFDDFYSPPTSTTSYSGPSSSDFEDEFM